MDYGKLVDLVSSDKRGALSSKLADVVLLSKNDEKMPSELANTILRLWQLGTMGSESGLIALLEAAVLLEPVKTADVFTELGLSELAVQIKEASPKT